MYGYFVICFVRMNNRIINIVWLTCVNVCTCLSLCGQIKANLCMLCCIRQKRVGVMGATLLSDCHLDE